MFAHIIALIFDKTARIQPVNVLVPFTTDYGQLPIGLGTIAFDIIMIVTITSWLRSRMNNTLWMWIHRTSYIGFVAIFFHAALSGTDFDAPLVSALAWSTAAGLAILGISRIVWGRLPA